VTERPGIDGLTPNAGDEPESLVPVEGAERHFGPYLLRYEIASGGMATVYLARARGPAGFDRATALKRIHPHLAKRRDFVEMFLDEARLAARITHPNVCSVFDFGEVEGTYFIAMEYLVGQPLAAIVRAIQERRDLASSTRWRVLAARIVADACEGLHAAHELRDDSGRPLGVVHRDVSPHNVFVTYDGAVKVVDFGVAWAEGRLHHTQTGALKGKLGYMSPEQVRGLAIDRRLDVWSLGVCLWELLTVRRLFAKKQEVDMLQAVMHEAIVPPSALEHGIPAALDAIVMRALDRDVERRYPTARAMARELNAFVSSSGVSAGLADLSELMEELWGEERATKLGVVASVLGSGSDSLPARAEATHTTARPRAPAAPAEIEIDAGEGERDAERRDADVKSRDADVGQRDAGGSDAAETDAGPRPAPPARARWRGPAAAIAAAAASVAAIAAGVYSGAAGTGAAPEPAQIASGEPPAAEPPPAPVEAPAPRTERSRPRASSTAAAVDEAARERARGPGTVNVVARGGWADIYVGGENMGRTPRSFQLPAGRHVIELRPQGELPARRAPVTVRAGETSRLVVPL
jgi:serine/threonine-protein kinase